MKKIIILYTASLFLILCIAGYFYYKYNQTQNLLKDPAAIAKESNKKLLDKVGKIIALPTNEEPTIVAVTDVTKFKKQPFFVKAKNGDKILVYSVKQEVILYRESNNRIINIAPITIHDGTSPTSTPAEKNSITPKPTQIPEPLFSPANTPEPTQ